MSGAGDVNGDGVADLIVGAPGWDRGAQAETGADTGYFRVFSGMDGGVLYTFEGDQVFESFGRTVSAAGDVNSDGVADFIVGGNLLSRLYVSRVSVLLGDCNQDGVVDFLDIPPFIEVLATDGLLAQADVNEDGVVDFLDIGPFVALLSND